MAWIQAVPGSRGPANVPMIPWPCSAIRRRSSRTWRSTTSAMDASNSDLTCFGVVGEELIERGAIGRVADPGVAGRITAGSESRPDAPEQLHVRDVPVDVAGSERIDLLGGAVLVEPLRERRAVLERGPLGRVAHERAVAVARQRELLDHQRVQQADEVRARADDEAGIAERPFERARAADLIAALEHEHRPARPREVGGGGEPVVASADDDGVPGTRRQLRGFRSRHRAIMPGCPP